MLKILSTFIFSCCFHIGFCQLTDSLPIHSLEEVVVKENRIELPFSKQNRNIEILNQYQIQGLPAASLNELLAHVSGVDVRQRGPQGIQTDISIDGGTFDETLVLINGIKVSDPQTGHNMMNLPITPDVIEHIEVLRGAAARIYGINTLTGAINIVTKKPTTSTLNIHALSGSNFKKDDVNGNLYASYGIRATGSLYSQKSRHLIAAAHEAGNGYRYNTGFNNSKLFYEAQWLGQQKSEWNILGGYIYNNFGANGYYSAPGDKEAEETVQTALAAISYKSHLFSNWIFFPRISYRFNQDEYRYMKQNPSLYRNLHITHVINTELNNTLETSIGTFGIGVEARTEIINSSNLGKQNRTNIGSYGEFTYNKIKNFLLNAGAYLNYNSNFGWQLFPGADIGYEFYNNWKLFVNMGTGQRLPTYTDLYYKGPTNIGNNQLHSETSFYIEGGLKYNKNRLSITTSYFFRKVDDFIDWVKQQVTDPWQPQNFQQIRTQGYTFYTHYSFLHNIKQAVSLWANISYTYLNPSLKQPQSFISQYAIESLRHQFITDIHLGLRNGLAFTGSFRYNERIHYNDYTLVDTKILFEKSRYHFYASLTNVLNTNYTEVAAVPMPGRWCTLGFQINVLK